MKKESIVQITLSHPVSPSPRTARTWCPLAFAASLALTACGGGGDGGPFATAYTIGGTLTGLGGGKALVLTNNGTDDLSLSANGAFAFATKASAYKVVVKTQPVGQTCAVANGSGVIAGANVTNVEVTCGADDTIFQDGFDGVTR